MKKKTTVFALFILGGLICSYLTVYLTGCSESGGWKPAESLLTTRWMDRVSPRNVHQAYPRPQMVRKNWQNLNGLWELAVLDVKEKKPETFEETILVPYPIESALSGLARRVDETQRLWYRRTFRVNDKWRQGRLLLHFGAVDWEAVVYINGQQTAIHRGGYDRFTVDITGALINGAEQEIVVSVWDPSDKGNQPVGKQTENPRGIRYTPSSGIWQTVWLEPVPSSYIQSVKVVPDVDAHTLRLAVTVEGDEVAHQVKAVALAGKKQVGEAAGVSGKPFSVDLLEMHMWSPEDPFLYDLEIGLIDREGKVVDQLRSYFGMRKIHLGKDEKGITRLMLNGAFTFQLGPLDQGFWPDGLYTAPCDEALRYDIEILKKMGFNMARKHVKVEPDRWYYWCDKLGLMVWQDMPNGRNTTGSDRKQFERELYGMINGLDNHPSIIMWVPFNEGWGQYDSERITKWVRALDPSRLVNHASGWHDRGVSDVKDIHSYPDPRSPEPEEFRAAVLGEFGGLGFNVEGHAWNPDGWGYALLQDYDQLASRYESLYEQLLPMIDNPGLSAAVYTQVSDIESENNGLMTYDREIIKIDPGAARNAHLGYLPPKATPNADIFVDRVHLTLIPARGGTIHYTLDGSEPDESDAVYQGPVEVTETTTLKMRTLWEGGLRSRTKTRTFRKAEPKPALQEKAKRKIWASYYEGEFRELPEFGSLSPGWRGEVQQMNLDPAQRDQNFALKFDGFLDIPETGVYIFYTRSDDGTKLFIDDEIVVDNSGVHGTREKHGALALQKGLHALTLVYFQGTGGKSLEVLYEGPSIEKQAIPPGRLFH